jgi:hypothetical protein
MHGARRWGLEWPQPEQGLWLHHLLLLLLHYFVSFLQAMQALDEKHLMEGSVTVKWADPYQL